MVRTCHDFQSNLGLFGWFWRQKTQNVIGIVYVFLFVLIWFYFLDSKSHKMKYVFYFILFHLFSISLLKSLLGIPKSERYFLFLFFYFVHVFILIWLALLKVVLGISKFEIFITTIFYYVLFLFSFFPLCFFFYFVWI